MNARKLLAVARLIRLPLLWVSLADASVVALLISGGRVDWAALNPLWAATAGLYLLSTAINDLIDHKGDRAAIENQSALRINPVAAGRLTPPVALGIALFGAATATVVALASSRVNASVTLAAAGGILAYNFGAKRIPWLGLPLLGAIAAAVAAQGLVGPDALRWWAVPAIIAAHTTAVSAFAYAWEGRKPLLYGNNWFHLLVVCAAALAAFGLAPAKWGAELWPEGVSLAGVYLTWALFIPLFFGIFARVPRKERGKMLRFYGLNWLIALDAAFVLIVGHTDAGMVFALLFAGVVVSVRVMTLLAKRTETEPV